MINKVPKDFVYNSSTENLFLFYQRISELLFDYSPDSYKVSTHNCHTLCVEACNIYGFLKRDGSLARFYEQYIPDILAELVSVMRKDIAAKRLLGLRFEKYVEILEQCKNAKGTEAELKFFESNIINLRHLFSQRKYYDIVCEELRKLICGSKEQQEIIFMADVFVCELSHLGYSKNHIYNVLIDFFVKTPINDAGSAFDKMLQLFTFEEATWEIITFANAKLFGYYRDELCNVIGVDGVELEEVAPLDLDALIEKVPSYKWLKETKESLINAKFSVSLIKASVVALDPYVAYDKLDSFISVMNGFVTVFDNEPKIGYPSIACLNYQYKKTITFKSAMEKRPRLKQVDDYAKQTATALKKMHLTTRMFQSFTKTARFHSEALSNNKNANYTLVMLWTALEALFVDNSVQSQKSKLVIESLSEIIQRTYVIKSIKYLQYDLIRHLKFVQPELISTYNLTDIKDFIGVLFSNDDAPAVKDICDTLNQNPLLRSRIFYVVTSCCKTNERIHEWLKHHEEKINWQIKRIYRTRNLVVHTGRNVPYIADLIENLHDYVDFIMNFVICKSWSGEQITDIRSLIAEVKLDNEVHMRYLNANRKEKTNKHVFESLFGPSATILEYYSALDV